MVGLQGDHDRMARLAIVAAAQFLAPPLQQRQGLLAPFGLIAQVVGPAAIGVDRVKMPQQPPRQQQRGDGEVLVMRPGQAGRNTREPEPN